MGRGGVRVGAGRKPKSAALALVHGSSDRGTRPEVSVSVAPDVLGVPVAAVGEPEHLPAPHLAVWRQLAPLAHKQGTLTPETALAFEDLCEAIVIKRALLADIQKDGWTRNPVSGKKAHPLLGHHRGMMQRVEVGLARFKLAPIGKDEAGAAPVKELSPLERLQAQARHMKRGT